MGNALRARRGRPALTENELVDLAEAAAIRTGVDLAVLSTGRPTIALKDPIYEVSLVQHLAEYLLMYPALDKFEIGWEVRFGKQWVDIVLRGAQKTVLVEVKDFRAGNVNDDAKKLRTIINRGIGQIRNPSGYVLALWRARVPRDIAARVKIHYDNARGLDPVLTKLVAHKRVTTFTPARDHRPFAVALFKVLLPT